MTEFLVPWQLLSTCETCSRVFWQECLSCTRRQEDFEPFAGKGVGDVLTYGHWEWEPGAWRQHFKKEIRIDAADETAQVKMFWVTRLDTGDRYLMTCTKPGAWEVTPLLRKLAEAS